MNKNDSERLESILCNMGLENTDDDKQADVIIMNSCSVRASAEDRIFGQTRNYAKLKIKKPNLIICVTGCMPGRDKGGKLRKKLKNVDLFFPTKQMINLPKWLAEINPEFRREDLEEDYLILNPVRKNKFQAFVTIQTGCNHFCSYCVVPFSRGLEVNRPLKDVMDEVKDLAKNGYIEIVLLGQIVNHYIAPDPENFSKENPYKESDFAKLLWEVNQIEGIKRMSWTAPHPIFMTDEVIDALTLSKQMNYLHLPAQSGSNKILEKMNRRHTREFFLGIIKKIKAKKPGIALGTDFIVGFCGESEEDFEETISLYKECDFDISYPAQYSTRSGTVSAKFFEDGVPKAEKKRRWLKIQNMMKKRTHEKNQNYVGKVVEVLVDECKNGWCGGQSNEMKLTRFKGGEELIGKIVPVEIFKAEMWILWGRRGE
ncbi:MAG: tRNA (N6-isopentenyl adenosine(37)-C2)-methylthiotransferase MiaB [Candidatus Magasanikbacteria bacterium]|nr:tRNA (N6-isopentenyl adenosine(37)-C2)-methylthiotransferase MiaB [Candidatus Magasanikbacteria bacterium]